MMKPSTICHLIGHQRYPLDDKAGNIRNVDGCKRCGVILKARRSSRCAR